MMYFAVSFKDKMVTSNSLDIIISGPHVTLAYNPNELQKKMLMPYIGREVDVKVIGYANDGNNEGYQVELPSWLPYFNKAIPHITISISKNSRPVKTGYLEFNAIEETFTLKGKVTLVK